ncbi:MAG: caspase family protein [Deltaproteobacteria bacterium]|nr:caspase family protein [Deltaproteobacteria bacterium]
MSRPVFFGVAAVLLTHGLVQGLRAAPSLAREGLVESASPDNVALIVGVSHGLLGIDIDVKIAESIATAPDYQYHPFHVDDEGATTQTIPKELAEKAALAGPAGSFFFYYSGHGSEGSIWLQDDDLRVEDMRAAIEKGRQNLGPLARLVIMFDSCFSGSLLIPFSIDAPFTHLTLLSASTALANNLARAFTDKGRSYWSNLFVFASSREDESSMASENGSIFTVALMKAYDEVSASHGKMSEWVEKTKTYTIGHHPVERFSPTSLANESVHAIEEISAGGSFTHGLISK